MAQTTCISNKARAARISVRITPIATAAWLAVTSAAAQTAAPTAPASAASAPAQQLAPVTVTGRAAPPATIAGWGDLPLAKLPLQAGVVTSETLRDNGGKRLADIVNVDPAISDAYNAEGYWDYLTVRGFVLDNRYNFRRDGLPINAETSIALDNKSRVEVLKGTSGLQSGTSAPGGLANFVVKRPTDAPIRSAYLEWRQSGSVTGNVDLSQRFGTDNAFGVRLNAAAAHLDPRVRDAKGDRNLFALAADWRASADTLLEAEIEHSHQSQPSVPGFSMLGNTVPSPLDPRINLNNQPWSLPVVLDGTTGSLRWTQRLATDWRFVAHAASQHLKSDDRIAFPFGCSAEGNFDRYCSDGTFDLYDYRSEGEKRRIEAIDLSLQGKLRTGGIEHTLAFGVLRSHTHDTLPPLAFNFVGTGNIAGTLVTPPDPTLFGDTIFRDERSTELYVRDAIAFDSRWTAWLGARHTRIDRGYTQSFTSPSIALSYAYAPDQLVYASWGRGVESAVAPSLPLYTNASQVLPALQSKQAEIGLKGSTDTVDWNVALFDISRPLTADVGACDPTAAEPTCTRQIAGEQRHRGIEANVGWRGGPWNAQLGAQWLRARIEGSPDPTIDGKRPTNVPARTLKAQVGYDIAALPGLSVRGRIVHESEREVLPDNSAQIPGYTRVDADARYETRIGGVAWTWRLGVDNLFDRRAWRESPFEFSHVYLFPLAPRTWRVSVQADF